MTLVLHQHPFAFYCWKVLIALYEREVPFTPALVEDRAPLAEVWPMASIPVLVDTAAQVTLPESTAILEYVDRTGAAPPLIPGDRDAALQARLWDHVIEGHVMTPVQKIVGDRLRAPEDRDPTGVAEARDHLDRAYDLLDGHLAERPWVAGDAFTLADCTAASALFYADVVHPWQRTALPSLTVFLEAVTTRSSVARVIDEARPYRVMFPLPWPEHVA
ncbi:MAG TPA: glutathione S-transferase family protein [Baekduia sp.]|nr:glutathione S-transferase family protein [Baekduia sp.]